MADPQESVYDRIGGSEVIDELVTQFYERVFADPELATFFQDTAREKLIKMQREFFAAALGGPIKYSGLSLAHAHHGRGIRRRHFQRYVGHLVDTLEGMNVGDDEMRDVIERVDTYVTEITGSMGDAG